MLLSRLLPIAERQDMNAEVQHDLCLFPGHQWYPHILNSIEDTHHYLVLGPVLKMTKAGVWASHVSFLALFHLSEYVSVLLRLKKSRHSSCLLNNSVRTSTMRCSKAPAELEPC